MLSLLQRLCLGEFKSGWSHLQGYIEGQNNMGQKIIRYYAVYNIALLLQVIHSQDWKAQYLPVLPGTQDDVYIVCKINTAGWE